MSQCRAPLSTTKCAKNSGHYLAGVSGGRAPPTKRVRELWAMVGRKGGKSRMAAAIAVYLALFVKYKLSRGERGMGKSEKTHIWQVVELL